VYSHELTNGFRTPRVVIQIFSRILYVGLYSVISELFQALHRVNRWNVTFNMLLISLMDDTQPYRAEVRDRSVHS